MEVQDGRIVKSDRTTRDLFTYLAYVDYVIDGDTLWVTLDQDLGALSRQKLRLRAIDAPELVTAAGKRAFEFLKSNLAAAPYLLVRSHKNDKYDRYEADLFIPITPPLPQGEGRVRGKSSPPPAVTIDSSQFLFINNLLLERGYAGLSNFLLKTE